MKHYTEVIPIRFTKEEVMQLKKQSKASSEKKFKNGKDNFTGWMRERILCESGIRNQKLERQVMELRYELRKIGTNINQVTRKINGGLGSPQDITELLNYLNRIEGAFEKLLEEAGKDWRLPN